MTDANMEQLRALDSALRDEKGSNALFITESPEDWQTLLTAGILSFRLDPDQDSQSRVLEMLQMYQTSKTIIVFNRRNDWHKIIKDAREMTTTEIQLAPTEILKRITALNENPLAPNASKYLKKIEKYCRAAEEQANPRPGNILEYLTGGKYAAELADFQKTTNIKTLFPTLDQKLSGGLYAGLYVIGAASSTGKTTFALQLADQLAQQKNHILFFSMEQSRLELVTKSISRISRKNNPSNQGNLKNSLQIRKGYTSKETEQAMQEYQKNIAPYMNIIEGNFSTTADTIRATVQKYIQCNNVRPVVIIDYLQIVKPNQKETKKDMRLQMNDTMTALKMLSRDLDTPVIVISSVNRGSYYRPLTMDSFKESGQVEFTADVLLGLEYSIVYSFDKESDSIREQKIDEEKQKSCINLTLKGLKNRYGIGKFKVEYAYIPAFDYFKEKPQGNTTPDMFRNVPMR